VLPVLVAGSASVLMSKELLDVHASKDTLELLLTVDQNVCSAPTAPRSWPASSKSVLIPVLASVDPMHNAKLLITELFAPVQRILLGILLLVATSKQVEICS